LKLVFFKKKFLFIIKQLLWENLSQYQKECIDFLEDVKADADVSRVYSFHDWPYNNCNPI